MGYSRLTHRVVTSRFLSAQVLGRVRVILRSGVGRRSASQWRRSWRLYCCCCYCCYCCCSLAKSEVYYILGWLQSSPTYRSRCTLSGPCCRFWMKTMKLMPSSRSAGLSLGLLVAAGLLSCCKVTASTSSAMDSNSIPTSCDTNSTAHLVGNGLCDQEYNSAECGGSGFVFFVICPVLVVYKVREHRREVSCVYKQTSPHFNRSQQNNSGGTCDPEHSTLYEYVDCCAGICVHSFVTRRWRSRLKPQVFLSNDFFQRGRKRFRCHECIGGPQLRLPHIAIERSTSTIVADSPTAHHRQGTTGETAVPAPVPLGITIAERSDSLASTQKPLVWVTTTSSPLPRATVSKHILATATVTRIITTNSVVCGMWYRMYVRLCS